MSAPPFQPHQVGISIIVDQNVPVLNFSQGGLAIQTKHPLTMGGVYHFRMSHEGKSVTLDGEVVRCNLTELAESMEGEALTLYLNGVQFMIERNPIELSMLDILFGHMGGEKRSSPRMKPRDRMTVDIGRPCINQIHSLSSEHALLESTELPDGECQLSLMIQAAGRTAILPARVMKATPKNDAQSFEVQVAFLASGEENLAFLEDLAKRLV